MQGPAEKTALNSKYDWLVNHVPFMSDIQREGKQVGKSVMVRDSFPFLLSNASIRNVEYEIPQNLPVQQKMDIRAAS